MYCSPVLVVETNLMKLKEAISVFVLLLLDKAHTMHSLRSRMSSIVWV